MTTPPRVSVIIPAYHSDRVIAGCLRALAAQTLRAAHGFEVIVVSSSNEEHTRAAIDALPPDVTANARFEQSPVRMLPHAARNRGVSLSRGSILVFTDPDCRARPDWLERLVAAIDCGHDVVGGAIATRATEWTAKAIHLCKFSGQLAGSPAAESALLPTANVAYTRRAWERVGPFRGDLFCGDALLSAHAQARGLAPIFLPDAVVEHEGEGDLQGFLRQRVGRGAEFARVRAESEGWSRARAYSFAALTPIRVPWLVARVGKNAATGGALRTFVTTLPIQLAGQAAWVMGEARAALMHS